MRLAEEMAAYYRLISDDQDESFLTPAMMASVLNLGYQQFRRHVMRHDTSYYELVRNEVAPNANFLSLNGTLMGAAAPAGTRLERIVRIIGSDGATPPNLKEPFQPAVNYESLMNSPTYGGIRYWLQGTNLRFNVVVGTPFQIQYVAAPNINWAAGIIAGSNVFVDDLCSEFGDLVPLYAYQQYAAKDFANNPHVQQQLVRRIQDFDSFLTESMSGDAAKFVVETGGW